MIRPVPVPKPRPVPKQCGVPSPAYEAFQAQYVATGTVEWQARCACGSGLLVTWLADRDGNPPTTCTCTCAREGAA